MANKNPSPAHAYRSHQLNKAKRGPSQMISKCKFGTGTTVAANDVIEMFSFGALDGLTITGVKVFMEQVDTGAGLVLRIGNGDVGSGVYLSDGLLWGDNITTLGRTSDVSIWTPSTAQFIKRNQAGLAVDIQIVTVPATPAWDNKTVWMILDTIPTGFQGL